MLPLLVWESLSGITLSGNLQAVSRQWREHIDADVLTSLVNSSADQESYAKAVNRLLQDLEVAVEPAPEPEQSQQIQQPAEEIEFTPDHDSDSDTSDTKRVADRPWYPTDLPAATREDAYRVFTSEFDRIIPAEQMLSAAELARLRISLDQQLQPLQGLVTRLANRLQRRLLAQQQHDWEFDLNEGLLDARRLPQIVIHPLTPLAFKQEKNTEFRDTVVTLLIDNSRSMKGWPISIAAMSADIITRTLERCGVKAEILGFTTHSWRTRPVRGSLGTCRETPKSWPAQ